MSFWLLAYKMAGWLAVYKKSIRLPVKKMSTWQPSQYDVAWILSQSSRLGLGWVGKRVEHASSLGMMLEISKKEMTVHQAMQYFKSFRL